jgi:transcriptional regulator with XRE-family HTH domain
VNDLNIGNKLKNLRKGRRLTQTAAAELMGVSRCTVSNYECGRRSPHLSELKRIAEFYGVGLDYFGVVATDEATEIVARAKRLFENPDVPHSQKEELFMELAQFASYLRKE